MTKRHRRSSNQAAKNLRYLHKTQNGVCFYCNNETFLREQVTKEYCRKNYKLMATFDHIQVKSDGGSNAKVNGVCACFDCNQMRGNLPFDLFTQNFEQIQAAWNRGGFC